MRTRWIVTGALTVVLTGGAVAGGTGLAMADGPDDKDTPITGPALAKASAAALAHTKGGKVTETEQGDEDGFYEVEVTLPDGREIDVRLDKNFAVVSSETDHPDAGDED